jgi:ribosome-binding ATPase YchF (GTP1/OBG family)
LESEKPLRTLELPEEELRRVRGLNFLTLKPTVAVVNVDERHAGDAGLYDDLVRQLEAGGNTALLLSAEIEMEIAELAPEEQPAFLEGLGIPEPAAHRLSRAAHERLGLISFFTVSPDEVRAWTAPRGVSALAAAGKIHTDMERGFIRAEVIPFAELAAAGSEKAAREANLYRLKGKEYVVEDGEVIYIRFNV